MTLHTTTAENQEFDKFWHALERDIYETSKEKGFHGSPITDNVPTKLMLIVTEIAEAMEAHRTDAPSDKIGPAFSGLEEELADAVIRIMDLGAMLKLDLPVAILAKMDYNKTRPHMHGGKHY